MDDVRAIDALAVKLKRPARLWTALAALPDDRLRYIGEAVDAACRRREADIESALRRALPPIGGLLVKLLRRDTR